MTDTLSRLRSALADQYQIEREIGRGGMATVYLAHDLKHDRPVAIKVLRPELAGRDRDVPRFLREIRIAARLTHPAILPLHDSGELGGFLFYVMPYLEGETLRDRLRREGRLPVDAAVRLARTVAAALDHAHRHDVVHRDIKPENILLHEGGPVVADFGVARAISATLGAEPVTEGGIAVGTPAYMSPEQAAADRELDGRSDLYSLACVVYEMLAGEPPFSGPSARATMARHVTEAPAPLRARRADIPAAVEAAVAKALAKDPAHRFATSAEFADALAGPTPAARPIAATRTIAVLPFVNVSPDPDSEYLADGITEELIGALAKVEGLRVASRTSVFALKGQALDVRTIGAALGVGAVLEGSVRKAGARLRITARLTNTDDGRHLWSERYDRELADVFAIEDEIARTIVGTLRATLLAGLGDPTPPRYTANVKAYSLYLKGRYCWNTKRTNEGIAEAIGWFEQAIAEDPGYALAYSGLSDAHALHVDYRGQPVAEGLERAKALARRALELDEELAEAHTSLGWVLFIHDWDWDGAEREFARAIALNPGYATAHHWAAWPLTARGRFDAALARGHAALDLDPGSVSVRRGMGWLCYYARRPDEAIGHLRRAVTMNPTAEETHRILGLALALRGDLEAAEASLREALAISEETAYATAALGLVAARAGRRVETEALLAELYVRAERRYVSPVAFTTMHIALGEHDRAFAWLERAHAERRGWLAYLKVDPVFDPLRADPRFAELVSRMRL